MKEVAAWKRAEGVDVEDLAREAVVLQKMREAAAHEGILASTATLFFEAQIAAAKEIQRCWISRWEAGTAVPPDPVPDLKLEIRPRLIEVGRQLLAAVKASLDEGVAYGESGIGEFAEAVNPDCLTPETRNTIHASLAELRLAD